LPPSDDNGTSDPYIKVWGPFEAKGDQKKAVRTSTINDNNNPIYYQSIESYFYSVDVDANPPIILEIYDADSGAFDSDDFIGRAVIDLRDAAVTQNDSVARPKWHPVKLGFKTDEPVMGQVLVSFSVMDHNKYFKSSLKDTKLRPLCDEYEITINVLGLRNLESPGILPVRKAFINFFLRSLLPPSRSLAVENISTQPSATGSNPTISTVIKFSIYLPNDPLYCPSLTCGVYDYILKGLSQPLVGNFVIPIGELQHFQDDQFEEEDARTQELIKSLDSKIRNAHTLKPKLEEEKKAGRKSLVRDEEVKKRIQEREQDEERAKLASGMLEIKEETKGGDRHDEEQVDAGDIGKRAR